LEELKIKIQPYDEKIRKFEMWNEEKSNQIAEKKTLMDKLDIGTNEDAQILKQKVNIVVSISSHFKAIFGVFSRFLAHFTHFWHQIKFSPFI
jgi:ribosomal protein S8E